MRLREAIEKIKEIFPKAICINGVETIKQSGLYLVFDGCDAVSPAIDLAKFALVLAANSLDSDNFAALRELEQIRAELFRFGAKYGKNYYKQTKTAKLEGSTLYLYAVIFEIEINVVEID